MFPEFWKYRVIRSWAICLLQLWAREDKAIRFQLALVLVPKIGYGVKMWVVFKYLDGLEATVHD